MNNYYAGIVQWLESQFCNLGMRVRFLLPAPHYGQVGEWLKPGDCKSPSLN